MKMYSQRVGDNIINIKDLNLEHLKRKKKIALQINKKENRKLNNKKKTGY